MPEPGLLESGSVWATDVASACSPKPPGGGARFRTAAYGGNSDIPRDFMKVSVAATTDIAHIQERSPQEPLSLSSRFFA